MWKKLHGRLAVFAGSHSHCLMSGEWKLRGSVSRSKGCACEAGFVQSLMKFICKTKAMLINSPLTRKQDRRGEGEREGAGWDLFDK